MNILRTSLLALALVPAALSAAAPAQPAAPAFDSSIVSGLGARNIGSAAMSGRISSLDAVTLPDGKLMVWVGAASGGVWKSLDGAHDVHARVRRPARAVDRRGRDRQAQSRNRLGRHRRSLDAQQRLHWQRHLQDDRRRRHLAAPGARRLGAHQRHPHRSARQRHRVCLRHRAALERFTRARRVPYPRRRQDLATGAEGAERLDRLRQPEHGREESRRAVRGTVGFPPQGLDVPLGRRIADGTVGECTAGDARRRPDVDRSHARKEQGLRAEAVRPHRGQRRPQRFEAHLRVRRVAAERAVRQRRRRRHLGSARPQPVDGLATVLFRAHDGRPEQRRPCVQGRRQPDPLRGRRPQLQRGGRLRRHAWRHPRRVGQPAELEARGVRRRRRPVAEPRRRQQVVEGREPADLAVLPRERRRRGSVPRLRRPAGQQQLDRRLGLPRRHHQQPLGKHVRRRRLLDVLRSGRSRLPLRGIPGRRASRA